MEIQIHSNIYQNDFSFLPLPELPSIFRFRFDLGPRFYAAGRQ